jgi:hypothetical protein
LILAMMMLCQSSLRLMRRLIRTKTSESVDKRSLNAYLTVLRSLINFMLIFSLLSYAELMTTKTEQLSERSSLVMPNVNLN